MVTKGGAAFLNQITMRFWSIRGATNSIPLTRKMSLIASMPPLCLALRIDFRKPKNLWVSGPSSNKTWTSPKMAKMWVNLLYLNLNWHYCQQKKRIYKKVVARVCIVGTQPVPRPSKSFSWANKTAGPGATSTKLTPMSHCNIVQICRWSCSTRMLSSVKCSHKLNSHMRPRLALNSHILRKRGEMLGITPIWSRLWLSKRRWRRLRFRHQSKPNRENLYLSVRWWKGPRYSLVLERSVPRKSRSLNTPI
jgi:hypothetical protein